MPDTVAPPSVIRAPMNIRFDLDGQAGLGAIGTLALSFTFLGEAQGGAWGKPSTSPFVISASGSTGSVGRMEVVLGRGFFNLSATGSQGAVSSAYLVAPAFRSLFGVYRDSAPLFSLRAAASERIVAAYRAYAINAQNKAMTEYLEFPFNHIAIFEGQAVVFSTDGAFILGGDLDDAALIASRFELPPNDFKTSKLKRLPYMYVGSKTNAALLVTTIADEDEILASLTATNGRTRRAKMARGKKARYWAARIENRNGEDFAIDSIEYLPMVLGRKV